MTFPKDTTIPRPAAELEMLQDEFQKRFAPVELEERMLVDVLAHSEWRQRQFRRLETATWNAHYIEGGTDQENSEGEVFCRASKELVSIGRGMEAAGKNFRSALKQLQAVRASRAKAAAAKKPEPPSSGLFCVPKRI